MIDDSMPPEEGNAPGDAEVKISATHLHELLHQIVEITAALDRVETRLPYRAAQIGDMT